MHQDCIFCKIAAKQIPVDPVYEDDDCIAFRDINPAAPQHVLLIPKKHIANLLEISPDDQQLLGKLMSTVSHIAAKLDIDEAGFRLVVNTKEHGGQTVNHLHFHILGGRIFSWPPG